MTLSVAFKIAGLRGLRTSLTRAGQFALKSAMKEAVAEGAEILIAEMQDQLDKGPPVPSSGPRVEKLKLPKNTTKHLRRVSSRLIQSLGIEASEIPGGFHAFVGPQKVVYGPIHEFGGRAGRKGSALIPPRPYAVPALEEGRDDIVEEMESRLRRIFR